jgi:hypothetical protein
VAGLLSIKEVLDDDRLHGIVQASGRPAVFILPLAQPVEMTL